MPDEVTLGELARRLERIEGKLDGAGHDWIGRREYTSDQAADRRRLSDLERDRTWMMRAMAGAFLALLIEAAVIAMVVLG